MLYTGDRVKHYPQTGALHTDPVPAPTLVLHLYLRCDDQLRGLVRREGAFVGDVAAQRGSEFFAVVGEDPGVERPSGEGDVGHAAVEQVFGSEPGVDVDQHPVGGLALAGVAGDGVSVVEVGMGGGVELDPATGVHPEAQPPVALSASSDGLDRAQLAVGELQSGQGRGELEAVPGGEGPLLLPVDGDSPPAARVVVSTGSVARLDGEPVAGRIDLRHAGVLALADAGLLRRAGVAQHVADLVPPGPGAVGPSEVLARNEHPDAMLFLGTLGVGEFGASGHANFISALSRRRLPDGFNLMFKELIVAIEVYEHNYSRGPNGSTIHTEKWLGKTGQWDKWRFCSSLA